MTLSRISSRSELLSSKLRNRISPSELSTPLAVFYIRANTTSWCASYSKPSPQWIEKPSQRHIDYYNCLGSHLIARHQSIKICITCKARHHLLLYEGYAILKLAEVSALSVVRQDEDNKATLSATWDLLSPRSSSQSSRRSSSRRSRIWSLADLLCNACACQESELLSQSSETEALIRALVAGKWHLISDPESMKPLSYRVFHSIKARLPNVIPIESLQLADPQFMATDPVELPCSTQKCVPSFYKKASKEGLCRLPSLSVRC